MVPLSLLAGVRVGWRAIAGVALGVAGVVTLADPMRFDWHNHQIVMGHLYLLLAGFTWALAMLHTRRHKWHTSPLDALPWQMSVASVLLWILSLVAEPHGHLDLDKWQLWAALLYIGAFAGPDRHLGRRLGDPSPAADHQLARHAGRAVDRHRFRRSRCWASRSPGRSPSARRW